MYVLEWFHTTQHSVENGVLRVSTSVDALKNSIQPNGWVEKNGVYLLQETEEDYYRIKEIEVI